MDHEKGRDSLPAALPATTRTRRTCLPPCLPRGAWDAGLHVQRDRHHGSGLEYGESCRRPEGAEGCAVGVVLVLPPEGRSLLDTVCGMRTNVGNLATEADLWEVMERRPRLGAYGLWCIHPAGARRPGCESFPCGESEAWFAADRAALTSADSVAVMLAVAEVIDPCRRTGAVMSNSPNSYGLKHVVERMLTDHPVVRGYVSNGQMIVTVEACGFPIRRDSPSSPNVGIGMYRADVGRRL